MFEKMNLHSLSFDAVTGEPLIVLKNPSQGTSFVVGGTNQDIRYLMGEFSGAIADSLSPFTFIIGLLSELGAEIERLEILPEGELHIAQVFVRLNEKVFMRKCRPADAVLLSHRLSIPIFVFSELLQVNNRHSQLLEASVMEKKGKERYQTFCSIFSEEDNKLIM